MGNRNSKVIIENQKQETFEIKEVPLVACIDNFIQNPGLAHITELIFGYIENKSLLRCVLVSKTWKECLKKLLMARYLYWLMKRQKIKKCIFWPSDVDFVAYFGDWLKIPKYYETHSNIEELEALITFFKEFFDSKCDCTFVDLDGCMLISPFHYASAKGYFKIIKLVTHIIQLDPMTLPIEINDMSSVLNIEYIKKTNTPFAKACKNGHIDIIESYLEQYTKKEMAVGYINDIIFSACVHGQHKVFKFLMDPRYNINVFANRFDGNTIFHAACFSGNFELTQFVFDNSTIDFIVRSSFGATALHYACDAGSVDMVKYLMEQIDGLDILALNNHGGTIFHHACWGESNIPVIKFLIEVSSEIGLDINQRNNDGLTGFDEGIIDGNEELIQLFLELKAKGLVVEPNPKIFHKICQLGKLKSLKLLFKYSDSLNVDLNHKEDGRTALHEACFTCRNMEVVKFVLDNAAVKNINVLATDNNEKTILHSTLYDIGLRRDKFKVIQLLLNYSIEIGLDIDQKDHLNWNAIRHVQFNINRAQEDLNNNNADQQSTQEKYKFWCNVKALCEFHVLWK